jgi:hypothetical protein
MIIIFVDTKINIKKKKKKKKLVFFAVELPHSEKLLVLFGQIST